MSTTFVVATSMVFTNILRHKHLVHILHRMSEHHGPKAPLASVQKLQVVRSKCDKDLDVIEFTLEAVRNITIEGGIAPGEISHRALKGGIGPRKGMCGLCVCSKRTFATTPKDDLGCSRA